VGETTVKLLRVGAVIDFRVGTASELRLIAETSYRKFTIVGNFAFVDPFSGPGAQFAGESRTSRTPCWESVWR
jgi:hypothetical protein